jgi:hypothetical protein
MCCKFGAANTRKPKHNHKRAITRHPTSTRNTPEWLSVADLLATSKVDVLQIRAANTRKHKPKHKRAITRHRQARARLEDSLSLTCSQLRRLMCCKFGRPTQESPITSTNAQYNDTNKHARTTFEGPSSLTVRNHVRSMCCKFGQPARDT